MPKQVQREKPQDKTPYHKVKLPEFESISLEPVEDILEQLEELTQANEECGCWGESKKGGL